MYLNYYVSKQNIWTANTMHSVLHSKRTHHSTASNIFYVLLTNKWKYYQNHLISMCVKTKKSPMFFLSTTLRTCNYCFFLFILCFSVFISVFSFTFVPYWMHWSILCNYSVSKSLLFAFVHSNLKYEYNISFSLRSQCVCAFSWQSFLYPWNWHVLIFRNYHKRHFLSLSISLCVWHEKD